jgi:hypothetical protein
MITNLPIDIIEEVLFACDYRSILRMSCMCKMLNNINLESLLINKSKKVSNNENKTHYIPIVVFLNKHISTPEDMVICWLKYLFNENINFGYQDIILPEMLSNSIAIGFTGCKGWQSVNPTYNIFMKILTFNFSNY